jgi:hypothetical protein
VRKKYRQDKTEKDSKKKKEKKEREEVVEKLVPKAEEAEKKDDPDLIFEEEVLDKHAFHLENLVRKVCLGE